MNLEIGDTILSVIFPLSSAVENPNRSSESCLGNASDRSRRHRVLSEIICGPEKGLKSSLLFQAGVSYCDKGEKVLFICEKRLDRLPLGVHGMSVPLPDYMYYMKIVWELFFLPNILFDRYIDETEKLLEFLTSFHLEKMAWPSLILVDNLDYYFEHYEAPVTPGKSPGEKCRPETMAQSCAKLCALLVEVADFCSQKLATPCNLLLSCKRSDFSIKIFHLFPFFFGRIWNVNLTKDPSGDEYSITCCANGISSKIDSLVASKRASELFLNKVYVKENKLLN